MKKIIPLEDGDFYYTPEGYRCFTEQYLLKRGYCCESGCRHCPYGFDKSALKKNNAPRLSVTNLPPKEEISVNCRAACDRSNHMGLKAEITHS